MVGREQHGSRAFQTTGRKVSRRKYEGGRERDMERKRKGRA